MLGFPDFQIFLAYILCILSMILCVVYGIINWNKGAENEDEQINEELIWEEEEHYIEDNL